jgi:hypothetical protein
MSQPERLASGAICQVREASAQAAGKDSSEVGGAGEAGVMVGSRSRRSFASEPPTWSVSRRSSRVSRLAM